MAQRALMALWVLFFCLLPRWQARPEDTNSPQRPLGIRQRWSSRRHFLGADSRREAVKSVCPDWRLHRNSQPLNAIRTPGHYGILFRQKASINTAGSPSSMGDSRGPPQIQAIHDSLCLIDQRIGFCMHQEEDGSLCQRM